MGKIKNFQTSLEAVKITFLQPFSDRNASFDMVFSFKKKREKKENKCRFFHFLSEPSLN
jgi:hypothetical protein